MTNDMAVPVHIRRNGFDLAPELARIRAQLPLARLRLPNGSSAWLVTRYADVRQVFSDAERFGSDGRFLTNAYGGAVAADPSTRVLHGDITQYDPPDHTRLRQMIATGFTARRVQRLQSRVEAIVSETIDAMAAAGPPADLVQSFALPIPPW
jgi:cytochrome P450